MILIISIKIFHIKQNTTFRKIRKIKKAASLETALHIQIKFDYL